MGREQFLTKRLAERGRDLERLKEALDNSQSLLVAILNERRPLKEIEAQIAENRAALNPGFFNR